MFIRMELGQDSDDSGVLMNVKNLSLIPPFLCGRGRETPGFWQG